MWLFIGEILSERWTLYKKNQIIKKSCSLYNKKISKQPWWSGLWFFAPCWRSLRASSGNTCLQHAVSNAPNFKGWFSYALLLLRFIFMASCSGPGYCLWTVYKTKDSKHCFPSLYVSVPLIKGKSARETLEEKGLWEKYKIAYPYNPTAKFAQSYAVGYESMTNDADVNKFFSSFCW